jgi:hypothetical protein
MAGNNDFRSFWHFDVLRSLAFFFLTTALTLGTLFTALLLIFALYLGRFFSLHFGIGNRWCSLLLCVTAVVAALVVTVFTWFTRLAVFAWLTITTFTVVTPFATFFTLATFTFTARTLAALATTILTTVVAVFRFLSYDRFSFNHRRFFTGEQ